MSKAERAGDLEIVEDLSFQRREWRVQRGGWVVMAVLILLALLGLTGRGAHQPGHRWEPRRSILDRLCTHRPVRGPGRDPLPRQA